MTGYAESKTHTADGAAVVAQLRSVNHRYLEPKISLPEPLLALSSGIRKRLERRFERGRIEVRIELKEVDEQAKSVKVDNKLAYEYYNSLQVLQTELDAPGVIEMDLIARLPGVCSLGETDPDVDRVKAAVYEALDSAVDELERVRQREGQRLAFDMNRRIQRFSQWIPDLKKAATEVKQAYRQELHERIDDGLTEAMKADRSFEEMIVMYAEKRDVTEEIVRLESHVQQWRDTIGSETAASVGRKLDFILQEMQREINTIGSKTGSAAIGREVVEMKDEVARLREQVRNVQ